MTESVEELRRSLAGSVVLPADAGYDAARRCFNALVDRRPAVIARCLGSGDVAAAFDFARAHELEVAVRGGGHNPSGHCVVDGGLVIDLSAMRTVEVDADARVAHSGGGATTSWEQSSSRRRATWFTRARTRTRISSGACAAAAATSAWRRGSSSVCVRSSASSAAC
jgi:hypothetical protein